MTDRPLVPPRYATNAARVANRDTLLPALSAIFATETRHHWIGKLQAVGVTVAPINSVKEALADPQVQARNMIVDAPYADSSSSRSSSTGTSTDRGAAGASGVPSAPPVKLVGIPVKYSDPQARASIRLPPPALGEHTDAVLGGLLGMTAVQIAALKAQGVV